MRKFGAYVAQEQSLFCPPNYTTATSGNYNLCGKDKKLQISIWKITGSKLEFYVRITYFQGKDLDQSILKDLEIQAMGVVYEQESKGITRSPMVITQNVDHMFIH